jgi:hypothetical protein
MVYFNNIVSIKDVHIFNTTWKYAVFESLILTLLIILKIRIT